MKNSLKLSLLAFALVLLMSPVAHANDGRNRIPDPVPGHNNTAPEIDPSVALGGLTLLGGTLTVMRSRRRK